MSVEIEPAVRVRNSGCTRPPEQPGYALLRDRLRRSGWKAERIAGIEFWVRPGRLGCYRLPAAVRAEERRTKSNAGAPTRAEVQA